jgi:hypothetical protein
MVRLYPNWLFEILGCVLFAEHGMAKQVKLRVHSVPHLAVALLAQAEEVWVLMYCTRCSGRHDVEACALMQGKWSIEKPDDAQVEGLVRDLLHWHAANDQLPHEAVKFMKEGNPVQDSMTAVQWVLSKLVSKVKAELLPQLHLHELKVALTEVAKHAPQAAAEPQGAEQTCTQLLCISCGSRSEHN